MLHLQVISAIQTFKPKGDCDQRGEWWAGAPAKSNEERPATFEQKSNEERPATLEQESNEERPATRAEEK